MTESKTAAVEQVQSVLSAYNCIRTDIMSLMNKKTNGNNMRGFDASALSDVLTTTTTTTNKNISVKNCEESLQTTLEKLSNSHIDFDTLSMVFNQHKNPNKERISSNDSEINDELCSLQWVDHPITGKRVNFNTLDLSEITDRQPMTLKLSRSINYTFTDIIKAMEKIALITERRYRTTKKNNAADVQRLRDALYITKRKLAAKTELLKIYRSLGVEIESHVELEEATEESVDEFNSAKQKIVHLEEQLDSYKETVAGHAAEIETISKGYQMKGFELLGQKQKYDSLVDKLVQSSRESSSRELIMTSLQLEIETARNSLIEVFPNIEGGDSLDLISLVSRAREAINVLRRVLCSSSPPTPAQQAEFVDSVLESELRQIVILSHRRGSQVIESQQLPVTRTSFPQQPRQSVIHRRYRKNTTTLYNRGSVLVPS